MIGLVDKAEDGGLQLGDRSEHAAFEAPSCELGITGLDVIKHLQSLRCCALLMRR